MIKLVRKNGVSSIRHSTPTIKVEGKTYQPHTVDGEGLVKVECLGCEGDYPVQFMVFGVLPRGTIKIEHETVKQIESPSDGGLTLEVVTKVIRVPNLIRGWYCEHCSAFEEFQPKDPTHHRVRDEVEGKPAAFNHKGFNTRITQGKRGVRV
jgi:hypothetical protein